MERRIGCKVKSRVCDRELCRIEGQYCPLGLFRAVIDRPPLVWGILCCRPAFRSVTVTPLQGERCDLLVQSTGRNNRSPPIMLRRSFGYR